MAQSAEREESAVFEELSETTPLLAESGPINPSSLVEGGDEGHQEDEEENAPLQRTQIFLLCYTRVVEPIAFFSIFPYINSMIEKTGGIKTEDVGFYSGLIESLFSATQMCVMIFWGRAADRWGRKPILVFSLFGIAIATTLFGMSKSILQMILARCFAGVFAGTVVTVRAMLSENSTKHTQATAFSYFAFAGNLGIFVGSLIGGALERPAEKYPFVFGRIQYFHEYPYALPGIVTSVVAFSAALSTLFFVKETLHIHHTTNKPTNNPQTSISQPINHPHDSSSITHMAAHQPSIWELINHPGVARVMLIYNYVMLLAFTFTAVNPVFLYTPIKLGGIGFPPGLISATIALSGASQAVWLLLIFPPLHKRVGTGSILRLAAWMWPVFFAINPAFNFLLRMDQRTLFWVLAPPLLMVGSGVAMAFTASQLTVNDIAPSHETLGTLNAVVLALQSGLRAVAPALATSVYATGVKYQILGGQLFWLCNVLLACGLIWVLRLLPEKAEGRVKRR